MDKMEECLAGATRTTEEVAVETSTVDSTTFIIRVACLSKCQEEVVADSSTLVEASLEEEEASL